MAENTQIGWIGMGRMGYPMAERLVKAGYDLSIWNRTKSKAEPLAKSGGKIVDKLVRPRRLRRGVLDRRRRARIVEEVYFGKDGVVTAATRRRTCSSIAPPSRSRSRSRSASA